MNKLQMSVYTSSVELTGSALMHRYPTPPLPPLSRAPFHHLSIIVASIVLLYYSTPLFAVVRSNQIIANKWVFGRFSISIFWIN
jgi:hypothetical protein